MKKISNKENYTNSIFENIKNVDEYDKNIGMLVNYKKY